MLLPVLRDCFGPHQPTPCLLFFPPVFHMDVITAEYNIDNVATLHVRPALNCRLKTAVDSTSVKSAHL